MLNFCRLANVLITMSAISIGIYLAVTGESTAGFGIIVAALSSSKSLLANNDSCPTVQTEEEK